MFAFLYARVGNAADAEDLAQEAWTRAAGAIRVHGRPRHLRAWLFRIAKSRLAEWRKQKAREREAYAAVAMPPADGDPSRLQVRMEVERALAQLDEEAREAVVYVHMLGYSYKEGAELAGVPIWTFAGRAHRGRTKLREILSDKLDREAKP